MRGASGDDAPMLAGELGVGGDRSCRREVEIALERKSHRAVGGGELVQAHIAKFWFAEAKVAETESEMPANGIQLRQEPGGVSVGGEDLDDRIEVDRLVLAVDSGSLSPAVLEEFLTLGGSDELHGLIPVWADPSGPFTETDGPRRVRPESNADHQRQISTDRGSTGRGSGFALARAVRVINMVSSTANEKRTSRTSPQWTSH